MAPSTHAPHVVKLSHLWVVGLGIVLVGCCFRTMCVVRSSDCCRLPLWSRVASIFVLVCGRRNVYCLKSDDTVDGPLLSLCGSIFTPHTFSLGIVLHCTNNCCFCTSSSVHTCPYGDIFFKWAFLSTRCAIRVTSDGPEIALELSGLCSSSAKQVLSEASAGQCLGRWVQWGLVLVAAAVADGCKESLTGEGH